MSSIETLAARVRAKQALPGPAGRREIRNRAGVTLAEVAEIVGVTPQTVLNWEGGVFEPSRGHIAQYGELLRVLSQATGP